MPAAYVDICKNARKTLSLYTIKYLDFRFFCKYSSLQFYSSIRPGCTIGDPVVADIRCLLYSPDKTISYKLSFNGDWELLRHGTNLSVEESFEISALYNEPLKIKKNKYNHLQSMKPLIPSDYHSFYNELIPDN